MCVVWFVGREKTGNDVGQFRAAAKLSLIRSAPARTRGRITASGESVTRRRAGGHDGICHDLMLARNDVLGPRA